MISLFYSRKPESADAARIFDRRKRGSEPARDDKRGAGGARSRLRFLCGRVRLQPEGLRGADDQGKGILEKGMGGQNRPRGEHTARAYL